MFAQCFLIRSIKSLIVNNLEFLFADEHIKYRIIPVFISIVARIEVNTNQIQIQIPVYRARFEGQRYYDRMSRYLIVPFLLHFYNSEYYDCGSHYQISFQIRQLSKTPRFSSNLNQYCDASSSLFVNTIYYVCYMIY